MISSLVVGLVFLLSGLALRYWINRRKFYRRNAMGSEGFSSYESSWLITSAERLGKWIAYAMILFGVGLLWVYWRERKEKERTMETEVADEQSAQPLSSGKKSMHF